MGQEEIVRCGSDHFSRWLASYFLNIQQRLGLYSTPELKYLCQTAVITLFFKCLPWLEMDAKVGHFQCKLFRLFAVALLFNSLSAIFRSSRKVDYSPYHGKPTESSCPNRSRRHYSALKATIFKIAAQHYQVAFIKNI
jgi:hypothetical protein